MIIAKLEMEGGLWEYKEFDNVRSVAIFLLKNEDIKLRLAFTSNRQLKNEILQLKEQLKK